MFSFVAGWKVPDWIDVCRGGGGGTRSSRDSGGARRLPRDGAAEEGGVQPGGRPDLQARLGEAAPLLPTRASSKTRPMSVERSEILENSASQCETTRAINSFPGKVLLCEHRVFRTINYFKIKLLFYAYEATGLL